jgi:hypothetical protein
MTIIMTAGIIATTITTTTKTITRTTINKMVLDTIERNYHGTHSSHYCDCVAGWRIATLGLQPQLGISPKRRAGIGSADPGDIDDLQHIAL